MDTKIKILCAENLALSKKSGVGWNIALHVSLAARKYGCVVSAFQVASVSLTWSSCN